MKYFKNNSNTKKSDLDIYKYRIEKENLIWVNQVTQILKNQFSKKKYKINDLGCNLFQLYKGLKKKKLTKKFDYNGYDHDKTYINTGLKYFPELKKKYKIINLEKNIPMQTDISVISATLEHLNNPDKGLDNILKSTKKTILIRSFFGQKKITKLFKDKNFVDNPYYINQFTFPWLKNKLKNQKFKLTQIKKDQATKGKMIKIYPNIKRKFYIIIANKNDI